MAEEASASLPAPQYQLFAEKIIWQKLCPSLIIHLFSNDPDLDGYFNFLEVVSGLKRFFLHYLLFCLFQISLC